MNTMTKTFSKMGAALLAAAMLCVACLMATPAWADTFANTDKADVVVSNVETGKTYDAYRLIETTVNADNTLTRAWGSDFAAYFANAANAEGEFVGAGKAGATKDFTVDMYAALSDTERADVLAGLYGYIKAAATAPAKTSATAASGSATFEDVSAGAYFIVPNETANVYGVMLAVLEPAAGTDGTYAALTDTALAAKVSEVTVSKAADKASASLGDTVTYTVVVTLPTNNDVTSPAVDALCKVADTLPAGVTLDADSVKVYRGTETTAANTTGLLTVANNGFVFELSNTTLAGEGVSTEWGTYVDKLTIVYSGAVNNSAALAALEGGERVVNTNTATYTYNYYPYGDTKATKEASASFKTYGLEITKKAENATGDTLQGAKFMLYKDADCTQTVWAEVATDANGKASIDRIASGTYYLKETVAPAGYNVAAVTTITIAADPTLDDAGRVSATVVDTKGTVLPTTGGTSRLMLTIGGIVVMCGAVVALVLFMRRNKREADDQK